MSTPRRLLRSALTLSLALLALFPALAQGQTLVQQWSTATDPGVQPFPTGIAVDASGNVYVVNGSKSAPAVQKFDSNGGFITRWGSRGSGDGQFFVPRGIAVDASGHVYVADWGNGRVQKFDSNGGFITQWGAYVNGIAVDASDNVYVTSIESNRVQKFDSNGAFLAQWGALGSGDGQFDFSSGFFGFPEFSGVAVDASGKVYVADRFNNRVQKFDRNGAFLAQWGSFGSGDGQFYYPAGIAVDASGKVYVADRFNNRVQKFDSNGAFLAKWGASSPVGIAVDASDNVYVTSGGSVVQKFSQSLVANAGADRTVECAGPSTPVTLDGSGSADPQGDALTYAWTGSFGTASGPNPTVSLAPGTHTITLQVTDPSGDSDEDQVVIDIVDTTPPALSLNGAAELTLECHLDAYTEAGATATDLCDGELPVTLSGSVNSEAVGDYLLTYSATDASGNSASVNRMVHVVDTTPPALSLNDPETLLIVERRIGALVDPGATALDACDGPVAVSASNNVNIEVVGTYTITYSATDASGNSATATRPVQVVDTTPPVVTLNGDAAVTVECHIGTLADPGATALDACDGPVGVSASNNVNVDVKGTYTITYTATDASGNSATATRPVQVVDTTPPAISLNNPDTPLTVECHIGPLADPGATALDACDGPVAVSASNNVNVEVKGSYTITYTATDASGNTATSTRPVQVVDTTPPVVTLNGDAAVTVECHVGAYTEAGATALDACDGNLAVTIQGSVDINTVGTYTLTYSATDASGNSASASRMIHVVDTTPPSLTASLNPVRAGRHDDDDDEGDDDDEEGNLYRVAIAATDACDPDPAVSAYITQPLSPSSSFTVVYKKAKKNRIHIEQDRRRIRVKLEGPSESALRDLWTQALSTGGFSVDHDQVLRLSPKRDNHPEAKFRFDRQLRLISAQSAGLKLVAWAIDASANASPRVEVLVPHHRLAKEVAGAAEEMPQHFSLQPNYPNPFNPSTTLRYSLDDLQEVRLAIYNVTGQRVRVLVDQAQGPGSYEVEWDARDASGQNVAPGVYLYRLEAEGQVAVGKMLLAK